MNSCMASPLKRVGGKAKLHKWILSNLPDHETYIEVFGGSAPVLLNKMRPRGDEIYNDLDGLWVNTITMIREHGREVAGLVERTPYSRGEFTNARVTLKRWHRKEVQLAPLELARLHLVVMRQSFSATGRWWSIPRGKGQSQLGSWMHLPQALRQAMERLQGVHIEQLDYAEILKRYDQPRATFYLDPPYVQVEDEYYDVNRGQGFNHEELRAAVDNVQGSIVVSYYDDSDGLIRKLYEGWTIHEKPVTVQMNEERRVETELLIVRRGEWARRYPRHRLRELFDDDGNTTM